MEAQEEAAKVAAVKEVAATAEAGQVAAVTGEGEPVTEEAAMAAEAAEVASAASAAAARTERCHPQTSCCVLCKCRCRYTRR